MENKRGGQIVVACAAGGGTGALLALQIASAWGPLRAVFGGLVGALVGYLAYDPAEVVASFRKAFLAATQFRLDWARVKEWVIFLALAFSVWLTPLTVFSLLAYSEHNTNAMFCWLFGSLMTLGVILSVFSDITEKKRVLFSKNGNPISVLYWSFYALWWMVKNIPTAIGFAWQVTKSAFILMHSHGRVLCAVDSFIGAGVGFTMGSVIAGAIVGGFFGVLNYELVSKRWLKLVPVEADRK